MMKRGKHEIISEILEICKDGANKTRIVYQANLNFKTVNPHIELLEKNDLIKKSMRDRIEIYETTEKGISLLNNLKQVNSQLIEHECVIV